MSKPFIGSRVKEKELEELTSVLLANEQIQAVFAGNVVGKESIMKEQWLVVTDKRVIYCARSFRGGSSDSFYYNEISSVKGHKDSLTGHLELTVKGYDEKFNTSIKKEVEIMVDMISENVEKARSKESKPTIAVESPLDQIKKLKELLDMDAISEEEYAEKKKKLLESL